MQKTTAQSQQESQKTRAQLVLFWKSFYKKKNTRAFNVARPRQRNIYQITSPTTCNLHAYRQASELRLNSFYIPTTLFSFEQLIYFDYFIWRRVGWWRDGFLVVSWLVARWFLGGELVGGETPWWRDDRIPWQGIETIGSLSTDVFEPRTSTGSRNFSSLMRITPFSLKKSSCKC